MNTFEIAGALGLLSISFGVILKKRKREDEFYLLGGILLEVYSISIHDTIFIVLQIIFMMSALYDLLKKRSTH